MIAIGGTPPNLSLEYIEKDPWPQGIGIFDVSEMKWKDSYNPDAGHMRHQEDQRLHREKRCLSPEMD